MGNIKSILLRTQKVLITIYAIYLSIMTLYSIFENIPKIEVDDKNNANLMIFKGVLYLSVYSLCVLFNIRTFRLYIPAIPKDETALDSDYMPDKNNELMDIKIPWYLWFGNGIYNILFLFKGFAYLKFYSEYTSHFGSLTLEWKIYILLPFIMFLWTRIDQIYLKRKYRTLKKTAIENPEEALNDDSYEAVE